ncbi:MAG: 16S rRNA (guanine(527)-N(7))-methyltransferase RsmG [Rhodospirillales bacterium]|jgi:16S rRNA (guanine527-N7)-methyltransferase|nr:16S rRNA (guanine(527)-N(7))-methyltransferase RsmG [Rhodospirillales bacterium]
MSKNRSTTQNMSPEEFQSRIGVSCETLSRLTVYAELLTRWQKRINLISSDTLNDIWQRHMLDSAQLHDLISGKPGTIGDLGSGAGFPGLVLAILGKKNISLFESNGRKCSFLREVARQTATNIEVKQGRIENFPGDQQFDMITARALAPLNKLLAWSYPLLKKNGTCLFLKGENYEQELTESTKKWNMSVKLHRSQTNPGGVVLVIGKIKPVNGNH